MSKQIKWNEYEAAILLDYYLQYLDGKLSQKVAIQIVSSELRTMAKNRNIPIDDVYRNEKGIASQMQRMISAYEGYTVLLSSTALFTEVVRLFREDKEHFDNILKEAKRMTMTEKDNNDSFLVWLSAKVSPAQLSELYMSYGIIDDFCLKRRILKKPFLQTTDINSIKSVCKTIENSKLFNCRYKKECKKIAYAIRYYIMYIKENRLIGSENQAKATTVTQAVKKDETVIVRNYKDDYYAETYPLIYKKLYESMKNSKAVVGNKGVTVVSVYENIRKIARREIIKEILDNVSWIYLDGERYHFSETEVKKPQSVEDVKITPIETQSNIKPQSMEDTPVAFVEKDIKNESIVVNSEEIKADNDETLTIGNTTVINNLSVNLQPFVEILVERFPKGYRVGSPLELRKFKRYWEEVYGSLPDMADDNISKCIECCGVVHEEKVYLPQKMVDDKTGEKLFSYIKNSFQSGKAIIYYEALFKAFSNDFLECYMYNASMLRAYLIYMNDGSYCINKNFISKDKDVSADAYTEIKTCLLQQASPMEYSEIFKILSHIPEQKIRSVYIK